ncbi:outer membrane lipoprotein-sorting protein [Pokkaliibacter sp. MBI-7]|uniref:outer membrane lipoprotein-sorting protein n=1 Tax=Pokkaliibacter sp. MBI-7 TaxID=3040600 RepID=UPI00244B1542|nr:outer membrane lipoprotein-sorting protein [Pokkaliibacter sp. MBI-7]MDH2432433.1 outer membrane lipoprotein-sorting protein [Pokkaliibacter sp. MBI-7]
MLFSFLASPAHRLTARYARLGSLLLTGLLSAATLQAAEAPANTSEMASLTPEKLMEAVKWRADGNSRQADITLELWQGQQLRDTRQVRYLEQDKGQSRDTLMYISEPKDVAGTSLLFQSDAEKSSDDDSIYLYLPALRKAKQLAARNKQGRFIGSEFIYADLEWLRPEDFSYQSKGQVMWHDRPVIELEATARQDTVLEKTGYSRKVLWVDPQYQLIVATDFYDEQGRLLKRMEVEKVEQIQNIWTITQQRMDNLQSGQSTRMYVKNISYDVAVNDRLFNRQQLGKRW